MTASNMPCSPEIDLIEEACCRGSSEMSN